MKKKTTPRKYKACRLPLSLAKAFEDKCKKEGLYQTDVLEALISKWTKRN